MYERALRWSIDYRFSATVYLLSQWESAADCKCETDEFGEHRAHCEIFLEDDTAEDRLDLRDTRS